MKGCEVVMNMKKKTGVVVVLLCMAAILAVVWYCLFAAGRRSSYIDGTFVRAVEYEDMEMERAA